MLFLQDSPHRRLNPLTGEWVLVSPHRTNRPWQGQMEESANTISPSHDPNCYLCPGSARANGQINPLYDGVFAFDNDFAALRLDAARGEVDDGLLVARGEAHFGIVYATDAKAEPKVKVVGTFPESSHSPIVYPVAIVASSKNADAASFVAFLTSQAATKILLDQGFSVLSK